MARVSSKPKASQTKTQKKEVTVSSPKRKWVEAEKNSLVRSKTGSAFARCEECKKDVPVMLVDMHDCSQESKIKMKMESMVVERVVEEKKQTEKKKAGRTSSKASKTSKTSSPKAKKAVKAKDPNMPKRPQTAFFVFMEEFRKTYKEEFPDNKSVALVGKAGGEKWKALSDEEKKVYLDKAAVLKEQYLKAMEKYNLTNENAEEQDEDTEKAESDVVDAEKEESNEADAENEEADEVEKNESDDLEKKLAAELEDEE